jgi:hypothetical protein
LLIESRLGGLLSAMNQAPRPARQCRCDRSVLDGESCLLCGRSVVSLPEALKVRRPAAKSEAWTQQGVIRALKAFAFFRGRAPVQEDWSGRMANDWPRLETVLALFGSVEGAVRVAGIEPPTARPARAVGE